MKKVLLVVLLSLFVCSAAHAAKFAGKWGGKFPYSGSVVMNLKQKGKSISGKIIASDAKYSVQGRVATDEIVDCTIIFIKDDCNDYCENSYTATMELTDDDTLLLIFDGVDCDGYSVDAREEEFIRY